MSNLATVQGIYAAFRRGDIPAILECLAEDVVWEYGHTSTTFLESGSTVVVLFQLEATVRATGRKVVEEDEVHIWHFDAAGKASRFRHRVDTLQHHLAYHGT